MSKLVKITIVVILLGGLSTGLVIWKIQPKISSIPVFSIGCNTTISIEIIGNEKFKTFVNGLINTSLAKKDCEVFSAFAYVDQIIESSTWPTEKIDPQTERPTCGLASPQSRIIKINTRDCDWLKSSKYLFWSTTLHELYHMKAYNENLDNSESSAEKFVRDHAQFLCPYPCR